LWAELVRRVLLISLIVALVSCGEGSVDPSSSTARYQLVAGDGAPPPFPLYGVFGGDTTYILAGVLELVPPDSGLLTLDSELRAEPYTSHLPLRYVMRDGQLFIFDRWYTAPPATDPPTVIIGNQLRWTTQLPRVPALSPPQLIDEFWFRRE
jgi:hypothetical protein